MLHYSPELCFGLCLVPNTQNSAWYLTGTPQIFAELIKSGIYTYSTHENFSLVVLDFTHMILGKDSRTVCEKKFTGSTSPQGLCTDCSCCLEHSPDSVCLSPSCCWEPFSEPLNKIAHLLTSFRVSTPTLCVIFPCWFFPYYLSHLIYLYLLVYLLMFLFLHHDGKG